MKTRFRGFLLLIALAALLNGCESTSSSGNDLPGSQGQGAAVSAIPWNKPASWEGAGALGGFMPQGGH